MEVEAYNYKPNEKRVEQIISLKYVLPFLCDTLISFLLCVQFRNKRSDT